MILFIIILILFIGYITNREHLVNDESQIVDNLMKHSLEWLKNITYKMVIRPRDISTDISSKKSIKKGLAIAIMRNLDNYTSQLRFRFNQMSLSQIQRYGGLIGIGGKDKQDIIEAIIKKKIGDITRPIVYSEEESGEESGEDNIFNKSTYQIPYECRIIYPQCNKDTQDNKSKYKQCLYDQNNYEECMMCFNNKINSSQYIHQGFKTKCEYKDIELLCMKNYPDTCQTSKYLKCPCLYSNNETNNVYNENYLMKKIKDNVSPKITM